MVSSDSPRADILFEISWEVCNKVGGIHTVLTSKLPYIRKLYPHYVLIGPQLHTHEFEEQPTPELWQPIFDALKRKHIHCSYGHWLVPGEPDVILIDAQGLQSQREALKFKYWEQFKIDSLHAAWEFEEPMFFSTAAGMLVEEYARQQQGRIVVQCHEWMAGFALLHLTSVHANVATVFTTHATILGRTIMGNGHPLYEMLDTFNPLEWAYKLGVQDKHLCEVACATHANVFTTVSEITGKEATAVLGVEPQVLLFNGFYTAQFPTFEETSIRHAQSKQILKDFISYAFFPHYQFDLSHLLIFFTSGRYEFTNKGMDVLIEALGIVNNRLKEEESDLTIMMFFWVIMGRRSVRVTLIENKNFFNHVKSTVDWQSKPLLQQVVLDLLSGREPGTDDAFTRTFIRKIHREVSPLKRSGNPSLLTHEIDMPEHDPVLTACEAHGLQNKEEDRVKVVLYPGYLDGSDGLLNLRYYDATVGAHLGIFPSHYEPWGYTPMEAAVLGVPAITTDLAGFGRYMGSETRSKGIFVIERERRQREEVVQSLAEHLYAFSQLNHEDRVRQGYMAKAHVEKCDWKHFIHFYTVAHNMALEKRGV